MQKRIPVAVLAATGSVGQRFVQLLDRHPWFEVVALTGSERTAGKLYGEACSWIVPGGMPTWAREMKITGTTPTAVNVAIAFSALPADQAKDIEPQFAQAGIAVCSNASAYRREPDVPILLPEINADHAALVTTQRAARGWTGCLTTNPNCTSTGLTIALKALQNAFGLRKVMAVSLQALSGAGYPGVPSMDIIDNVVPYIGGEEEKVEWEPRKMLGTVRDGKLEMANFVISAHTNRVAVTDGHMVCCSVETNKPCTPEEAIEVFRSYQAPEISRDLPSAPNPIFVVREEQNRPQPRLDRMEGNGMATVIGRVRKDPLFTIKFIVLSHNTIRGAAGGSIYNAELLVNERLVQTQ